MQPVTDAAVASKRITASKRDIWLSPDRGDALRLVARNAGILDRIGQGEPVAHRP
jgi:hypothetical protein